MTKEIEETIQEEIKFEVSKILNLDMGDEEKEDTAKDYLKYIGCDDILVHIGHGLIGFDIMHVKLSNIISFEEFSGKVETETAIEVEEIVMMLEKSAKLEMDLMKRAFAAGMPTERIKQDAQRNIDKLEAMNDKLGQALKFREIFSA